MMLRALLAAVLLAGCTMPAGDDPGPSSPPGTTGAPSSGPSDPSGPCAPSVGASTLSVGAGCTWLHARLRVTQEAHLRLEAFGSLAAGACSHAWMGSLAAPRDATVGILGSQDGSLCVQQPHSGQVVSACCLGLASGEQTVLLSVAGAETSEVRLTAQTGSFEVIAAAGGASSQVDLVPNGTAAWSVTTDVAQSSWALVQARGLTPGRAWAESDGQRWEAAGRTAFITPPGRWSFGFSAPADEDAAAWVLLLHGAAPLP